MNNASDPNQANTPLTALLLQLLPADHSAVGNGALFNQFSAACQAAGLGPVTQEDFQAAREALLAAGAAVKGRGRGGATARATGADRPAFALQAPAVPATSTPAPAAKRPAIRAKAASAAPAPASASGDAQVLAYRHANRRKNNPEVGLVNTASDPEQAKTTYAYDPHLDPMLQWAGKAEHTSFAVDTVSLHVHERIDAMSILSAVSKRQGQAANATKTGAINPYGTRAGGLNHSRGFQPGLFEAPFESLPLRAAVDFYKHDRGWANRLVSGDSLLVMNSLLQKEGMAGQVQMIYIDPPYGIKYGSNFQPFTNKRDVKDRSDADLTQEPEMIKAFRDTWELGIHSYLTYLRDRLLLAKDLLSETGSVFIQIGDENLHLARQLLDEVFGTENFLSVIAFKKTAGQTSEFLAGTCDYLVWYAKERTKAKYRGQLRNRQLGDEGADAYTVVRESDGRRRRLLDAEATGQAGLPQDARVFRFQLATSQREGRPAGEGTAMHFPVRLNGEDFFPGGSRGWTATADGMERLFRAGRLAKQGTSANYIRYLDDFTAIPITNFWTDTQSGSGMDKVYVVQTSQKIIERCMLMTTDPGDLVLDPTCGSGTTAYVAEKWGRRWITCDTSRVAITLAKQRLMTASFDYFALRYPHEGLKGGFIYKTVPHVTLKSIANNPEIDAIYERLHPGIEAALAALNAALAATPPANAFAVTEGARKGQKLALGRAGVALLAWEVPFDLPPDWPADRSNPEAPAGALVAALQAFHAARQKMQAEMDRSIAAQADSETLYDQPEKTKNKLRVSGPFTVEAVPFPSVLSLEEHSAQLPQGLAADLTQFADRSVARSGNTSRQHAWRDELLRAGIRGKGGQMLRFAELEVLPGTRHLHASGHLDSGERVVVSFGPEHGALEQRQVEQAQSEAGELFPLPKMMVFCAFAFDPEAAKDIDALKGITALKAQMNTDLLTEDLKKASSKATTNQSFWLMGQPDVALNALPGGLWQVEVNGFDYFDTAKGELVSGGKAKIAAWSLDTDYDGRSLFPHQVFFPMAGKDEGWMKLKKDIRAELDEDLLGQFVGTVSLPFAAGPNATVAVKIVDDRGIESLKVMRLQAGKNL